MTMVECKGGFGVKVMVAHKTFNLVSGPFVYMCLEKRTMNKVDEEEIAIIRNKLKNRSRRRLGFKTPSKVFHQSSNRVALRT